MIEICSRCENVAILKMTAEYLNNNHGWHIFLCLEHFLQHAIALGVNVEATMKEVEREMDSRE